jgi:hypothetical protein
MGNPHWSFYFPMVCVVVLSVYQPEDPQYDVVGHHYFLQIEVLKCVFDMLMHV